MRIVDRLFKSMMSDMLGISPWSTLEMGPDNSIEGPGESSVQSTLNHDEEDGEMIDLGDSVLIVVDNVPDAARVRAVVKDQHLAIQIRNGHQAETGFDLPYRVSVKRSGFSINNGVMEMRLPKILNEEKDTDSQGTISAK
jgi:hypothetical protein